MLILILAVFEKFFSVYYYQKPTPLNLFIHSILTVFAGIEIMTFKFSGIELAVRG